jgi:hypothetical protein
MQSSDRLVHRRFTKEELLGHEIHSIAQGYKTAVTRVTEYNHYNIKDRIRYKCRCLLSMFQTYRKNNRAYVLVQHHPKLRNLIIEKCEDVFTTERIFGADTTKYFLKKIRCEASALIKDLLEIVPKDKPTKSGKINI